MGDGGGGGGGGGGDSVTEGDYNQSPQCTLLPPEEHLH